MDHIDMFGQRRYKERNVRDGNLNAREKYGRLGVHIARDGLIGDRSCSGGDSPSY